eukprot:7285669-Alexandrium_andersonii.AAC.1
MASIWFSELGRVRHQAPAAGHHPQAVAHRRRGGQARRRWGTARRPRPRGATALAPRRAMPGPALGPLPIGSALPSGIGLPGRFAAPPAPGPRGPA